jgi:transposase
VIQHIREKFACRKCEAITQAPAPFHPIARGRAGPQLLAQILFAKYRAHLPLNRQSEIYASEGVDLNVSTLADWVGAAAATLMPLVDAIRAHVFAAERIHADDTPVPVLAKTRTRIGRLWTYVRDDRPFAGQAPPAAVFFYSPDRVGEHPRQHLSGWSGLMQAVAYAGYNELYDEARSPAPIIELPCWSHARRKFYELATLKKAPIAIEAVRRIDELFAIEREINGLAPDVRLALRRERSQPLAADLEAWLRAERAKLSSKNPVAKAINYSLKRWTAMTRFLADGRICLSNNAAERSLRGIAVGRHNWTFAGSDRGGQRAAVIYTTPCENSSSLMQLTCSIRSAVSVLRSRQSRRRSSSSAVGTLTIAQTLGSPRLYANNDRSSLAIDTVGLGRSEPARDRNRGRVDNMAFDALVHQHAVEPETSNPAP